MPPSLFVFVCLICILVGFCIGMIWSEFHPSNMMDEDYIKAKWISEKSTELMSYGIEYDVAWKAAHRAWEIYRGCSCKINDFGAEDMNCHYHHKQ